MLSILNYNTEKKEILFISTDKSVAYLKKRIIEMRLKKHNSTLSNNFKEVTFLRINTKQDGNLAMSKIIEVVKDKNIQYIFIDGTNILSQSRKPKIKKAYFETLKNFAKQYGLSIHSATPLKRVPPGKQRLFQPHVDQLYMKNAALSYADSVLLLYRSIYYYLETDSLMLFDYNCSTKVTIGYKLKPFIPNLE